MEGMDMYNNPWFKLAVVSLAGIIISFGILWGINEFKRYNGYSNMNMGNMNIGYEYHQMNRMPMGPQNGMMGYGYHNGMYMQGGMGAQGSMDMNDANMQGGMNMQGNMSGGMGMMGH
jgi:hypothetical protein